MTRKRAKLLMAIGWTFAIILSFTDLLFPNQEDPYKVGIKCERNKIPTTLLALTGLIITCSIMGVQIQTVLILWNRLHDAPGHPQSATSTGRARLLSTGRARLYKRAITACMIGGVWSIGWAPLLVVCMLNAWSLGDKDTLDTILPKFVIVAYILQSFSNAAIFRLRNLDKSWFICRWCRRRNSVSTTVENVFQRRRSTSRSPQVSILQATPTHSPRPHSSRMSVFSRSTHDKSTTPETRTIELLELPAPSWHKRRIHGKTTTQVMHGHQSPSSSVEDLDIERTTVF